MRSCKTATPETMRIKQKICRSNIVSIFQTERNLSYITIKSRRVLQSNNGQWWCIHCIVSRVRHRCKEEVIDDRMLTMHHEMYNRERERVLTNTASIMEEQRQRGDEKYNSARRIVERGVLYGRLDHVDLKRP